MRGLIFGLLCLFSFLIPLEYIYVVILGSDAPLKPYRLIGIILVLSVVFYLMVGRKILSFDMFDRLYLSILIYGFLLAAVRYLFFDLGEIEYTLNDTMLLILAFTVAVSVKNVNLTSSEIDKVLKFFACAVLLNVILIFWEVASSSSLFRARGFFKNPNQAALAIVLCSTYFLTQSSDKLRYRVPSILAVGFCICAVVFTGSRSALVALFINIIIWMLITSKSLITKLSIGGGLIYALYLGVLAIFKNSNNLSALESRFSDESGGLSSGSSRANMA